MVIFNSFLYVYQRDDPKETVQFFPASYNCLKQNIIQVMYPAW
jgi:hypothetical protein